MIKVQSGHKMTLGLMSVTVAREVFSLSGCRCCGNKEVPKMLSGLGRHDQEGALWEEMGESRGSTGHTYRQEPET